MPRSAASTCAICWSAFRSTRKSAKSPSRPGVQTHSLMMSLMAVAQREKSRGRLLTEIAKARLGGGLYRASQDELTRPGEDLPGIVPAAYLALRFLLDPTAADRVVQRTVDNYALTTKAVQAIRDLPETLVDPPAAETAGHGPLAKARAGG